LRIPEQPPKEGAIVRRRLIPLIAVATLFAAAAGAQTARTAQPKMPVWDTDFSLGLISNSAKDEGQTRDRSSTHADARFDIGHYWTQHVKAEAGVGFLNTWDDYEFESFPVPALPGGGYSVIEKSLRMTIVTPAVTYQFLENQFAHPYVSVGARVVFLETHSTRSAQTYTQNRIANSVPALDRTDFTVLARPVVAAGYKSYFNERTFMRSEVQVSLGPDGRPYPALRVGFGFDF
jgi:hypothetical protein